MANTYAVTLVSTRRSVWAFEAPEGWDESDVYSGYESSIRERGTMLRDDTHDAEIAEVEPLEGSIYASLAASLPAPQAPDEDESDDDDDSDDDE